MKFRDFWGSEKHRILKELVTYLGPLLDAVDPNPQGLRGLWLESR